MNTNKMKISAHLRARQSADNYDEIEFPNLISKINLEYELGFQS